MRRIVFFLAAATGLACAGGAAANSPKLKGEYAFTGTGTCLYSIPSSAGGGGFNANLQPNPNSRVYSQPSSVQGVRTFNGDGTGTVKGTTVSITPPPTPAGIPCPGPGCFSPFASSSTFEASFTYTVQNDGTFTSQLSGLMTGQVLSGPNAGQTFTIDVPPLVGLIGDNAKTLTIAHVVPVVETITQNGTPFPRICNRSRVLVKMKNDKDD